MGTLWQDVRYGLRMLGKSPGFTAVVLLVIGVGIGANTALFNALDQVYARPLPVKKPHELVSVQYLYRHGSFETTEGSFSYPDYETYRERAEVFAGLVAFGEETLNLRAGDAMTRVQASAVSTNYFAELGIRPALGRLFAPSQEQADATHYPLAVISHSLWHRQFGGDASAIGKQIILDEQPLTVIGVAPRGFTGTVLGHTADVYLPIGTSAHMHQQEVHKFGGLCLLGRLKAGFGREQAQAAVGVLAAQMREVEPDGPQITMLVVDGSQGYVPGQARSAFYPLALFLGMAVLVLVIACANIANLLLSRAATRHKEIAVRRALGAGRRRVLRQLLVESLLLALAGGIFGVVLAVCLDRMVCTALTRIASIYVEPELQVRIHPGLHPRVLLFALAISLVAGIAFGLAPALQMVRRSLVPALKESAGYGDQPARGWNPHSLLVAAQIAIAVVVMVCSGLCLRSLIGLHRIDPGYDTRHILVVRLDLDGWLSDRPDLRRFMEGLQERANGLPGVVSASLAECPPVSEASSSNGVIDIEGFEMRRGQELIWRLGVVSPGHFQTLGQALLAGRDFTVRDGVNAPKVMVVNEVLARRYWPNQNPLGKRVTFGGGRNKPGELREVVGVVTAVKLRSILEESVPVAYLSLAQQPKVTPVLLVRTAGKPQPLIPVIRKEAAAIGVPAALDIRTVAERISGLLLTQQILTGILNIFGFVGLLLSATGIYAVMAYAVRQRTREIGIRMALGARGRDVLLPVLLQGALLTTVGLALGLGLSLAGTRVLAGLLPQIRAWDKFFLQGIYTWDPLTYVCTTLVILTVVLLACYVPARRATRIDPMVALRYE